MNKEEKLTCYRQTLESIHVLIGDVEDEIAIMATVACELHNTFEYYHWTGFYRCIEPNVLTIGPYQGNHGCLIIPFDKGICGKAAREKKTQLIDDVNTIPYHIACSSETRSEIVVPILDKQKQIHSVLDIDSHIPGAFDEIDRDYLEKLALFLQEKFSI